LRKRQAQVGSAAAALVFVGQPDGDELLDMSVVELVEDALALAMHADKAQVAQHPQVL
jgi:hypothetical protein